MRCGRLSDMSTPRVPDRSGIHQARLCPMTKAYQLRMLVLSPWGGGRDAHPCSAAAPVLVHFGAREAVREATVGEGGGLFGGPAVTGEALSAQSAQPFDGH